MKSNLVSIVILPSFAAAHLCQFYDAMGGSSWLVNHQAPTGWSACPPDSADSACDWHGVTCDESSNVVSLELPFAGVSGEITADLFVLSDLLSLSVLNLSGNELTGELPGSGGLCDLHQLEKLDMSWNHLEGALPGTACWSNLLELSSFDVSMNYMSGELDPDLFEINDKLKYVDLAHNGREFDRGDGVKYPGFLGKLPYKWPFSLEWLDVSQNSFTLSLEPDLCSLTNLVILKADKNFLNGEVSSCFMSLSSLRVLDLRQNQLSGTLPDFDVLHIEQFLIGDNYFSGPLPEAISQAPNLDTLDAHLNSLSGVLPDSFASQGIRSIDLSSNAFSGPVPPAWSTLTSLTSLDLSDNALNGTFDSALCLLPNLIVLDVSYNDLSGSLPSLYTDSLEEIDFTGNALTGTVPTNISGSFISLGFGDNFLVGGLDANSTLCSMASSGLLAGGNSCEDLACPAGTRGNDAGAPFNAGCVECINATCQPYLAQSECGEGCERNWTEVWEGEEGEGGLGEGGEEGEEEAPVPEEAAGGGKVAGIIIGVGAGVGIGVMSIGAFAVVRNRRRRARQHMAKQLMEDVDDNDGGLKMQRMDMDDNDGGLKMQRMDVDGWNGRSPPRTADV